ncbi:MAG: A/G-specific adenine glycosylase [Anaerolineales bacterium]|jgi:A/G-specific adenine glycosylase|nr:A/G-specific adenine glycosylase [Anaerolineales bacterium]MCK5428302.1 A/G-specific adenine glycosylase [Anaerolineales bacterium]
MVSNLLAQHLLNWYGQNKRALPWREIDDPYTVWVSEIMLQQTRVETVIPYYASWMKRFPTIAALAQASEQDVLMLWEGLGYYRRARYLHRAAQIVMSEYDGSLPADVNLLRELPGIGHYTAGAIASIAYGLDEAALDGNIRRVLARLFDITEPIGTPESESRLRELAVRYLPVGKAGDYNQALMDLGATICTPRNPNCSQCPLHNMCQAYAKGVVLERPVTNTKPKIPHYTVTAAVIQRNGKVLIAQRPLDGLLGGLWEFPGGKIKPGEALVSCLQREIREELDVDVRISGSLGVYRHAYTHFRVTLHAFACTMGSGDEPLALQVRDIRWIATDELQNYPMGKIDRQIATRLING